MFERFKQNTDQRCFTKNELNETGRDRLDLFKFDMLKLVITFVIAFFSLFGILYDPSICPNGCKAITDFDFLISFLNYKNIIYNEK